MRLSTSEEITQGFVPHEVPDLKQVARLITQSNWSCGVFKDGYRNTTNFEMAQAIALDFDNDPGQPQMSLNEALDAFKEYRHVISTSRNHQKPKGNRPPADRFRVLLFLDQPVTDPRDFRATWESLAERFPGVDPACKDATRFFYKSRRVVQARDGAAVPVVKYQPSAPEVLPKDDGSLKGRIAASTIDFILNGAPEGTWNQRLMKAAIDLREQGYSVEQAKDYLTLATRGFTGELDPKDLKTIEHQYAGTDRHPPRGGISYNFVKLGDLRKRKLEVEWLVEGLLFKGGLGIVSGPPKSGKSTIVRQLMKSVIRDEPFLGRKIIKPGPCLYVALEDYAAMVAQDLRTLGFKDDDDLLIHCDPVRGENYLDQLELTINNYLPQLVVIDTFALFAQIQQLNDYSEVNSKMESIRSIARNTDAHILLVHHTNKSDRKDSGAIMGSQAIFGAVDCSIVFTKEGDDRMIKSEQRGGRPFNEERLAFDPATLTYRLENLSDGF